MENNTSALFEEESCQQSHDAGIGQKVGRTVALSFTMSLALVGNLLVIIIFKRYPTTRANTNFFIVNMAASDLLFPFFTLPHEMVIIWVGSRRFIIGGEVGEFLCKFTIFMPAISLAVSTQSLVLIAVERYTAVVYPLNARNLTARLRTILIIVTWIVAAVLHSPYFYFLRLVTRCNRLYCVTAWTPLFDSFAARRIYYTTLFILVVYIPLLVIVVLYVSLSLKLRRMKAPGGHVGDIQDIRRRERNKRITKMSICIVIAFSLCCLPYVTYFAILYYSTLSYNFNVNFVVLQLVYANSAINPYVLFYFCGNFRQGLRDMFGCCPCFSQRSNPVVARNIGLQEMERNAQEN